MSRVSRMFVVLAVLAGVVVCAVPASCQLVNFINQPGTTTSFRTGSHPTVGYWFQVSSEPVTVTALGRYVWGSMTNDHEISLWRDSDHTKIASVTVTANSAMAGDFKYEMLTSSVTLLAGGYYRVLSSEGGDTWGESVPLTNVQPWAVIKGAAWDTTTQGVTGQQGYVPPTFFTGNPVVPEPTSALALLAGLTGIAGIIRRRR